MSGEESNALAVGVGVEKTFLEPYVSGGELPLEYGLALERELQVRLFASADAKEGLRAYNEKRKPNFKGV